MNWQDNYFDENYIPFYSGIITPERTQKEVDFLVSIFTSDTKKVLDIPCGFGRHSIELAKRGYEVLGVDGYESQIRVAKKSGEGVPHLNFIKADMRESAFADFDVAINMFSSFGYFSRAEDKQCLENFVHSVKEGGGMIVIDVRNPARILKELEESNWNIYRENELGSEREVFDADTGVHTLTYIRSGITKYAEMNVYQLKEYLELFNQLHCTIKSMYGDYSGSVYSHEKSPRLIMVAERN